MSVWLFTIPTSINMKMLAMLLFCSLTLALPAEPLPSDTSVLHDEFKKSTTVISREIFFGKGAALNIHELHFTARGTDGRKPVYLAIISTQRSHAEGWAFWRGATDQNGKEYEITSISTNADGNTVSELSSVTLSRDYMESIKVGIKWRLYGKHATADVELPSDIVRSFLEKCDEVFAAKH